jgi:hypothetical protein
MPIRSHIYRIRISPVSAGVPKACTSGALRLNRCDTASKISGELRGSRQTVVTTRFSQNLHPDAPILFEKCGLDHVDRPLFHFLRFGSNT